MIRLQLHRLATRVRASVDTSGVLRRVGSIQLHAVLVSMGKNARVVTDSVPLDSAKIRVVNSLTNEVEAGVGEDAANEV